MTPSAAALLRRPLGWVPIALSAAALVVVLGYVAVIGIKPAGPAADEGSAARIFQLLILADAFLIGIFGLRWLPEAPRGALVIMAIQVLAAAVPVTTILLLEM